MNCHDSSFSCIWYDFVSYSQRTLPASPSSSCCIWYDFVSYSQRSRRVFRIESVVYDTILSAIHNQPMPVTGMPSVVYDTILSAIHNSFATRCMNLSLYMIRFCQLFTTRMRCTWYRHRCIWYDFVSYSQQSNAYNEKYNGCIWYDFVSYSQPSASTIYVVRVVYDTILSAIHNVQTIQGSCYHVVYDTILSAIHNDYQITIFDNSLYMIRFCQLFQRTMVQR